MNFILKLFGLSSLGFIPNWGPRRMQPYEAFTYRYLGIKPEVHYVWSRRFQSRSDQPQLRACEADPRGGDRGDL
jgi:hypothetical protein